MFSDFRGLGYGARWFHVLVSYLVYVFQPNPTQHDVENRKYHILPLREFHSLVLYLKGTGTGQGAGDKGVI